ncbi:helix-turn-helix domain-containing protein [Pseudomonas monteilii]|uniref:helix-turn-helix domain-containing protein n=1 Tax=Pseudomonas monteilii TaxID=76759 RepID=UPI0039FD6D07
MQSELARQRHSAGLTQKAIAMMLSVSPGLISKWEKGAEMPAAARSLYRAAVEGQLPACDRPSPAQMSGASESRF